LNDPSGAIFEININELDKICNLDSLVGAVRISIRIDSSVNDRLRNFREHAERQLGRPVSVLEAVNACICTFNGADSQLCIP
jgi:hypothetical protein